MIVRAPRVQHILEYRYPGANSFSVANVYESEAVAKARAEQLALRLGLPAENIRIVPRTLRDRHPPKEDTER